MIFSHLHHAQAMNYPRIKKLIQFQLASTHKPMQSRSLQSTIKLYCKAELEGLLETSEHFA